MPRPRSPLTTSKAVINVRVVENQKIEFLRLGGSKWLRQQLDTSIQQRKQKEQIR